MTLQRIKLDKPALDEPAFDKAAAGRSPPDNVSYDKLTPNPPPHNTLVPDNQQRASSRAASERTDCLPALSDGKVEVSPLRPLARLGSKLAAVIALIERPEGASLNDIITATGWLPHSARAALTGLRLKGMILVRSREKEQTVYRTALTAIVAPDTVAIPDAVGAPDAIAAPATVAASNTDAVAR